MSSITVNTLVLGSLTVAVDGSDSTLALSVLGTAPASLTIELGTPGAQGNAATIAVGTTTTLSPGASATVANVGTSSAAVFNFGIPQGQTGATGATGAAGSPGTAATISAGTTTTLSPGASATVTNSGTSGAAVFDFGIPAGQTGATGATGATGPAGPGVAAGGTAGQSLLKVDGTDYNTAWGTPALASHSETTQATVRNATGSTLTPGQIVYINGALGNRPTVALSKADAESTSAGTYAMIEASIANNADGTVITSGTVMYLDTSALADGDKLYLSPTTAGAWTTTKPSAPNHLVYIGTVTRAHPTQGTIQLRIQNGYELDELHDVAIASKTDNDLLAYESSTNLWKNKSFSTLGLQTSSAAASTYLAKASNLSDLVSASTARTNLGLGTAAVEPATKLVPTGGTTGQALVKNSGTNWDLSWATVGGGGGGSGSDLQTFGGPASSGTFTWTKPANAKTVYCIMFGGGGGGGSGAFNGSGAGRAGGGGGSGGSFIYVIIDASDLSATETVTVGAGGAGGAGVNVSGSGLNGSDGGNSTFKRWRAVGGAFGSGGTTTSGGAGGTARTGMAFYNTFVQGAAGAGGAAGASGVVAGSYTNSWYGATGGGGGGGATVGTVGTGGGGGGNMTGSTVTSSGMNATILGGLPGSYPTQASNGIGYTGALMAGTGGGGGYFRSSQPGGYGGSGGWPAGGGGGGGAADSTTALSGAGGNGGNGYVYILTIC